MGVRPGAQEESASPACMQHPSLRCGRIVTSGYFHFGRYKYIRWLDVSNGLRQNIVYHSGEWDIIIDGSSLTMDTEDMFVAQQYTATTGMPSFRAWAYTLQKAFHSPPTVDSSDPEKRYNIQFTNGGQEGINQALEIMINEGDDILVQTPLSNDVISSMKPLGCNIIPTPCDKFGIIPDLLRNLLENRKGKSSPKFIYCCPTGNNPTGSTLSLERRHELYALARHYDLVIIEHDPYYHIKKLNYPPSLLSLDTDGRVVRIDSFSSTIAPGIRLGMVSGPNAIISAIEVHLSTSSMHVSSLTQMICKKLLDKWNLKGFVSHCQTISFLYESQKSLCKQMLKQHLEGLCEWENPDSGLFLWLKLKQKLNIPPEQIDPEIFTSGKYFFPDTQDDVDSEYIRVCFSSATADHMEEHLQKNPRVDKHRKKRKRDKEHQIRHRDIKHKRPHINQRDQSVPIGTAICHACSKSGLRAHNPPIFPVTKRYR
ncbi:hypothetical protein FSP39_017347 [Pinctada imbricata]|uniref:Aminotransferase class I/classII large domain-containing protein n=1 Tax=Pinctada imbricata TaxID=66713 RepID=A0AA89BXN3_PINIB|nr:hypothetical protein FSP39_017347 [Pinctada imbricata]